jgi:hypothetical protein
MQDPDASGQGHEPWWRLSIQIPRRDQGRVSITIVPPAVYSRSDPPLLDVPVSPCNLHIHVPSSDESGQAFGGEECALTPEDSPSAVEQLTSPIGAKLLRKKVQQQAGFDADKIKEVAHVMVNDPNQCSSPCSTELIHRRVAFQRARNDQGQGLGSLGPQLSSPVGTALLNRKLERQRRMSDPIITGADHNPNGRLSDTSFRFTGSDGGLRYPEPSANGGAGDAALADEEPPAVMGVPARTAWEASAVEGEGNLMLSCLRCLGKQQ